MNKNNIIKGIAAAPGIAIAKAYLYKKEIQEIEEEFIQDVELAIKNFTDSLEKSKKELNKILLLAVDKMGKNRASIFEAQIMILDDPVLIQTIKDRITKEKRTPCYIVSEEISKYQKLMEASEASYMQERAHDIEDIKNRIIRNLKKKKWKSRIENDEIVVTESITPADTVLFSRVNVRGYVTNFGGLTSHAAIVARSLNIPAVLGIHDATLKIKDGDTLIVDGLHGDVIINPTDEQLKLYKQRYKKLQEYDVELAKLKDKPAETLDGRRVILRANLDINEELEIIIKNGAEGTGLVRTEQIFHLEDGFPTEDEQVKTYSDLAEKLYPNMVVIRAFDIGGDKVFPVDVKEPNPFLGWRGIRFLLDNNTLFKTQIRAVLRAGNHKNVKFMVPMVSSIQEIRRTKEMLECCKNELREEGLNFDNDIKLGIMIEVPSAALMAKEFAAEVDFISIGTNDLIQYLLAVDRGNEIIASLYQEFHPAVVKMLDRIITGAKESDARISMCGEMAADILAIPLLVGLGLDSLSVSASAIPHIKKIIRSLNYKETQKLAKECLTYSTEEKIKQRLKKFFNDNLTDERENVY
jgi:phosphotransferase system enzyme I (PtsI)